MHTSSVLLTQLLELNFLAIAVTSFAFPAGTSDAPVVTGILCPTALC